MRYRGTNPLGNALSADANGLLRDALMKILADKSALAGTRMREPSTPAAFARDLSIADCATACAEVVKQFHALCTDTAPEHGDKRP